MANVKIYKCLPHICASYYRNRDINIKKKLFGDGVLPCGNRDGRRPARATDYAGFRPVHQNLQIFLLISGHERAGLQRRTGGSGPVSFDPRDLAEDLISCYNRIGGRGSCICICAFLLLPSLYPTNSSISVAKPVAG